MLWQENESRCKIKVKASEGMNVYEKKKGMKGNKPDTRNYRPDKEQDILKKGLNKIKAVLTSRREQKNNCS